MMAYQSDGDNGTGTGSTNAALNDLLVKTSRTFALAIPLLPEPTRREVGVAYLLFRIIDTFEDATRWAPARRIEALKRFVELMDGPPESAMELAADCKREPPVDSDGYLELLDRMPLVLESFQRLRPEARPPIRRHVARTAEGMAGFVARSVGSSALELASVDDLRDYCYAVAGIVGEMLTELFLLGRPNLAGIAEDLRNRAAEFGEGLQLVNILKDVRSDADAGRVYLPRRSQTREIFALARKDLNIAGAYSEMLRVAGAESGLVAFNAFIVRLAIETLDVLEDRGPASKVSRLRVAQIAAEVTGAIRDNRPLFGDLGPSGEG